MHPSFGITEIDVKSSPFQMRRIGWGFFDIPIQIFFRRETGQREVHEISHTLNFNGNGEKKYFTVTFEKDKIDNIPV